jgi:hypothetical protein
MATYIEDIRQGDTRVFQIDFGKGVDITGWIYYFILRKELTDSTNYLQVSTTAGDNALDDVANGLAFLTLTAAESAPLEPGKYYYVIKVQKTGNVIRTIVPPIDDAKDKVTVFDGIEIIL